MIDTAKSGYNGGKSQAEMLISKYLLDNGIKEIDTIVVGKPLNMNGTATERVEVTNKFIHKLKCKYNKLKIDTMDERLTTVEAHRTMNDLNINPKKKKKLLRQGPQEGSVSSSTTSGPAPTDGAPLSLA